MWYYQIGFATHLGLTPRATAGRATFTAVKSAVLTRLLVPSPGQGRCAPRICSNTRCTTPELAPSTSLTLLDLTLQF